MIHMESIYACIEQDPLLHLRIGKKYKVEGNILHGQTEELFLFVQDEFPVTGYYRYKLFFPVNPTETKK